MTSHRISKLCNCEPAAAKEQRTCGGISKLRDCEVEAEVEAEVEDEVGAEVEAEVEDKICLISCHPPLFKLRPPIFKLHPPT